MEFSDVKILCSCGLAVIVRDGSGVCSCGLSAASVQDGMLCVTPPTPYWGEISCEVMEKLLALCETMPWRDAVLQHAPKSIHNNAISTNRAAFQDVLPIPEGSRILDIGAGLGAISAALALRHHVVALEGVRERARFIMIRKRQDALENLIVLNGDLNSTRLAPAQFDAIIVNGVLEWAGLFDLSAPPEKVQQRFLSNLRTLLKPGGYLYVGIENRFGWAQLRGTNDHSGLPYTSLMPRWMARWVCSRSRQYRSNFNTGYRTYTYGFGGYRELFEQAGLRIAAAWIAPCGYNHPVDLVPLSAGAITVYTKRRLIRPAINSSVAMLNRIKLLLATEWFWRRFGSDYVFLLESRGA